VTAPEIIVGVGFVRDGRVSGWCPGVEMVPNPCTCTCNGCRYHCGAHSPHLPDLMHVDVCWIGGRTT
jgi:hypothetical protein